MKLKLYEKNNLPYTSVIINKTHRFNLLFDTGSQAFLTIDKNIFSISAKDNYSNTLYGKCKGKYVEVQNINVNNISLKATSIPIGVFSELSTHKNLLGLEFLLSFSNIYINNDKKEVFLY